VRYPGFEPQKQRRAGGITGGICAFPNSLESQKQRRIRPNLIATGPILSQPARARGGGNVYGSLRIFKLDRGQRFRRLCDQMLDPLSPPEVTHRENPESAPVFGDLARVRCQFGFVLGCLRHTASAAARVPTTTTASTGGSATDDASLFLSDRGSEPGAAEPRPL
jgi:hypothetical protein